MEASSLLEAPAGFRRLLQASGSSWRLLEAPRGFRRLLEIPGDVKAASFEIQVGDGDVVVERRRGERTEI